MVEFPEERPPEIRHKRSEVNPPKITEHTPSTKEKSIGKRLEDLRNQLIAKSVPLDIEIGNLHETKEGREEKFWRTGTINRIKFSFHHLGENFRKVVGGTWKATEGLPLYQRLLFTTMVPFIKSAEHSRRIKINGESRKVEDWDKFRLSPLASGTALVGLSGVCLAAATSAGVIVAAGALPIAIAGVGYIAYGLQAAEFQGAAPEHIINRLKRDNPILFGRKTVFAPR